MGSLLYLIWDDVTGLLGALAITSHQYDNDTVWKSWPTSATVKLTCDDPTFGYDGPTFGTTDQRSGTMDQRSGNYFIHSITVFKSNYSKLA